MNFTSLASKALAAVTAFGMFAPSVSAQNLISGGHLQLWNTVQAAGVSALINPKECDIKGVSGFYSSQLRQLVICQDNRKELGKEVQWTANDLDTLRHEAQHLIQDCEDGRQADGSLVPLMDNWDELDLLVKGSGLTQEDVGHIVASYRELGLSDDHIILEIEAFAVAAGIEATAIAQVLGSVCGVR